MTFTKSTMTTAVHARLAEARFAKRAGGVLTIDLGDGILGWLGLNTASKRLPPGTFGVNPVVGIRHQEIERLVAEFCGEKFHPTVPPTLSSPLGYLMPEHAYREWTFDADNADQQASDLATAVGAHALPFFHGHASTEAVCQLLEDGFGIRDITVYRLPVAQLLLGNTDQAAITVRAELAAFGDATRPAAERYRRFAERLLRKTQAGV